jgi:hypothetical protein
LGKISDIKEQIDNILKKDEYELIETNEEILIEINENNKKYAKLFIDFNHQKVTYLSIQCMPEAHLAEKLRKLEPIINIIESASLKRNKCALQLEYVGKYLGFFSYDINKMVDEKNIFSTFQGEPNYDFLMQLGLVAKEDRTIYIKELKKGTFPKYWFSPKEITIELNQFKEKYPTFLADFDNPGNFYLYYKGLELTFRPILKESGIIIIDENNEFTFSLSDIYENQKIIEDIIKKLEKKQRIGNLFERNYYHANRNLKFLEDGVIQKIIKELEIDYSPEEIEIFFNNYYTYKNEISNGDYDTTIALHLLDKYFLLNDNYDGNFYVTKDLKKLEEEFCKNYFKFFREKKD